MARRIMSGIQPTGELHLGNYLGALSNWARLQQQSPPPPPPLAAPPPGAAHQPPPPPPHTEFVFSIADLHAITVPQKAEHNMHASCLHMTAAMLASGIDPQRATIFVQSHVPQHCE
jgi:tryptophanyl-tRNA synthetase